MFTELQWLRRLRRQLDPRLRERILEVYRGPAWLPCITQSLYRALAVRMVRVPVLVAAWSADKTTRAETVHNLAVRARQHGLAVRRTMPQLGYIAGRIALSRLEQLAADPLVQQVALDIEVRALLDVATPSLRAAPADTGGLTGAGVTIAILDTGVYPHQDLAGRVVAFADFVKNRTTPYDDHGHGTHVAGCAAGDGSESGGRYAGPAPGAQIAGVKVLNKMGSGSASDILAGIEWCLAHQDQYGIRVLNLSLGSRAGPDPDSDPLVQAVDAAWEAGLVVCCAAGNSGPGSGTIASPAVSRKAIAVGAMDDRSTPDRTDDAVADFSSRGPTPDGRVKPDLLAPGVGIIALRAPSGKMFRQGIAPHSDGYVSLSGTSMATPLAAGVVALLLEQEPALGPDAVKQTLMSTAEDRGYSPNTQGAGYLDAASALASLYDRIRLPGC